jgi:threonylcarbamoyladenosine tRNA methylthiotransferase MtaB
VQECEEAARAGHYEIVLTGIRLASYGRERGEMLMDAVEAAAKTEVGRIRLGSLDPDEIDAEFIRRAADCEKLCRHFHLSLQSGSDSVLRRMGRRYTAKKYTEIVGDIRKLMPDASFTTDVMSGFVGETEEEHLETCQFVRDIGFLRLHVFPYSKREGTAAAHMQGHLPQSVKQQRARELIQIVSELESVYARNQIGNLAEVVWEQIVGGALEGHARNYLRVHTNEPSHHEGEVSTVLIRDAKGPIALA